MTRMTFLLASDLDHEPDPEIIPYRNLITAILYTAIYDLHKAKKGVRHTKHGNIADVYYWIADLEDAPFSFKWCLDQIDWKEETFWAAVEGFEVSFNHACHPRRVANLLEAA